VPKPNTYVLATNRTAMVRDFVRMAFRAAGMELDFRGEGVNETAVDTVTGNTLVRVNPKFYRPTEVDMLLGDPSKARRELGWEPKTTVEELCRMMVEADLRRNERGYCF